MISVDHSALENNGAGSCADSLIVTEGEVINAYKNSNPQYQDGYLCYESFERIMNYDQKCYDTH